MAFSETVDVGAWALASSPEPGAARQAGRAAESLRPPLSAQTRQLTDLARDCREE